MQIIGLTHYLRKSQKPYWKVTVCHTTLGSGFLFLWSHEIVGFRILCNPQSPKPVFEVLVTRMSHLLEDLDIVYDNSWNGDGYCLNHEPARFEYTRFLMDKFHQPKQQCEHGGTYKRVSRDDVAQIHDEEIVSLYTYTWTSREQCTFYYDGQEQLLLINTEVRKVLTGSSEAEHLLLYQAFNYFTRMLDWDPKVEFSCPFCLEITLVWWRKMSHPQLNQANNGHDLRVAQVDSNVHFSCWEFFAAANLVGDSEIDNHGYKKVDSVLTQRKKISLVEAIRLWTFTWGQGRTWHNYIHWLCSV